jgi:hypothetical protein
MTAMNKEINSNLSFTIDSFFALLNLVIDKQGPKMMFLRTYIEALIFELLIKRLYLLDNSAQANTHHRIDEIFEKLNNETQTYIKEKFDNRVERVKKLEEAVNDNLCIPKLECVLKHNQHIVTNFKYDSKLKNGNTIDLPFLNDIHGHIKERS